MLQVASGDVARQQQHATMTLCVPISFVQEFVIVFFFPLSIIIIFYSTAEQQNYYHKLTSCRKCKRKNCINL